MLTQIATADAFTQLTIGLICAGGATCTALGYIVLKGTYQSYKEAFKNLAKIREIRSEMEKELATPELQQIRDLLQTKKDLQQNLGTLAQENKDMRKALGLATKGSNPLLDGKKIEEFLQEISREPNLHHEREKTPQISRLTMEKEHI